MSAGIAVYAWGDGWKSWEGPPPRYKMVQNETVIDSGLIAEKRRGLAGNGEMSQLEGSKGEL